MYAKVLQINLTKDTFQIEKNNLDETNDVKEHYESISAWLKGIAESGLIHPDDLEEYLDKTDLSYLRSYFLKNNDSLRIFYRRKINDEYQKVIMELIPSAEFTPEDQRLFLYVKYMC